MANNPNYNTTRVYENLNCEKNFENIKNQKTKILEKIISNILSKNFSNDDNIYNFINLKKHNSSKNLRIQDINLLNNINLNKEKFDKKEILSASKIGEGNKMKISNKSKFHNLGKLNRDKAPYKSISDENSKINETKDYDSINNFHSKTKYSECVSTNNNTGIFNSTILFNLY